MTKKATDDAQEFTPHTVFPIVGIGASAGGLAAFEAFFQGCPPSLILKWRLCWCST